MTVNVPIWAGLLYSALLIGGAFGAGIAAFRGGSQKAQAETAKAQRDAIEAMRQQIDSQKDTIDGQTQKIAALDAKVAALEAFNRQLTDLLTARPDWARISTALEALQVAQEAHTALGERIARHLGVD